MDSIIFDVDGTLWDSTEICAQAWNTIIRRETDLDMIITAEKLKGLFGRLLPDIAKAIFPDYPAQRQLYLIDQCCLEEHRALTQTCAPLYPHLEETLQELSQRYPLYIVSNCQAGYIEVFLSSSGLGRYFQGHLCPGDTGKAKADNIKTIIRENGLASPVYVGDTNGDFQACQEAGVPFVFASYGFGSVTNPDYTIKCPKELLKIF